MGEELTEAWRDEEWRQAPRVRGARHEGILQPAAQGVAAKSRIIYGRKYDRAGNSPRMRQPA